MARERNYKIGDRVAYAVFRPTFWGEWRETYHYGEIIGQANGKFIVQAEGGELVKAKPESLGDVVNEE